MSEGRLDPVAVREAIERLRVAFGASRSPDTFVVVSLATEDARAALLADIGLCLAALDEGREASAPFAAVAEFLRPEAGWGQFELLNIEAADSATAALARVPVDVFRRLAAFHEAVSEEKNDVR